MHCHACSSKKVLKAALAPTPGKPHRVCDSCYSKLKAVEAGMPMTISRKNVVSRQSIDTRDRFDRGEVRYSRLLLAPTQELGSYHDVRYAKNEPTLNRASQVSSLSQLKDMAFPSSMSLIQTALRPIMTPTPPPAASSRFVTPYTWRPSPTQSTALEISGSMVETLKKTNEHLDREVLKLQGQVKSLKQKLEQQSSAAQKALKKVEEDSFIASDELAKFNAAVELMKTLQNQMKNMEEKLPSDFVYNLKVMLASSESFLRNNKGSASTQSSMENHRDDLEYSTVGIAHENGKAAVNYIKEASDHQSSPKTSSKTINSHGEVQLTEQFEPGVYATLAQLRDGTKVFKRVRFSKKRFTEQQAEDWWRENQARLLKKYSYSGHNRSYSTSNALTEPITEPKTEAGSSH